MVAFSVEWEGIRELVEELVESQESIKRITMQNLANLGEYARYLCRIELEDVRYTGALAQSFVVEERPAEWQVNVYPTAKHSMFVRMGTRPHWAPIGPLKRWAAAKLGDEKAAYPVQRSIAARGTSMYQLYTRGDKANPWPARVVARSDFQTAIRKTAEHMGQEIIAGFVG